MGRYQDCTYFETLYEATQNCFSGVSKQNAQTILRETILAPNDYTVEFSDQSYNKTQIMKKLYEALILCCVHETPQQTHHDIVEQAAAIIKHMNDGYITDEDYSERQTFLNTIERYEFALFSAYSFLKTAHIEGEEREPEIVLNIIRLREINDLIVNYTRNEQGVTTDLEEYERAKPVYKMLKSLQNLGYDYNFSPKERESLNIDHEDDDDFNDNFNYENWLKRIMLLELRKELDNNPSFSEAFNPQINALRRLSTDEINKKIAQLRGTYYKRRFDSDKFVMLENKRESLNND